MTTLRDCLSRFVSQQHDLTDFEYHILVFHNLIETNGDLTKLSREWLWGFIPCFSECDYRHNNHFHSLPSLTISGQNKDGSNYYRHF